MVGVCGCLCNRLLWARGGVGGACCLGWGNESRTGVVGIKARSHVVQVRRTIGETEVRLVMGRRDGQVVVLRDRGESVLVRVGEQLGGHNVDRKLWLTTMSRGCRGILDEAADEWPTVLGSCGHAVRRGYGNRVHGKGGRAQVSVSGIVGHAAIHVAGQGAVCRMAIGCHLR